MEKRKVNVSDGNSVFKNKDLQKMKCKFAMNFFIDGVSRFALATAKDKVKFKHISMSDSFKSLCFSSLQLDLNLNLIADKLIETVKKSKEYKDVMSKLKNADSCAAILMVNAKFNEFKTQYQNDFDFEFTLMVASTDDMEVISKILLLKCNEVLVSEYEDLLFVDFENKMSILLGTEYSEECSV